MGQKNSVLVSKKKTTDGNRCTGGILVKEVKAAKKVTRFLSNTKK